MASLDQAYISNYATINIKDVLTRVDGVGDTIVFGARDYSMRVWLDPAKVQSRGLTASDVVTALRAANVQVAGGRDQPAAGEIAGRVSGGGADARPADEPGAVQRHHRRHRCGRPRDAGARHRPRRAWRLQLHQSNAYLDGKVATAIGIFQRPGSNALKTAAGVIRTMDELAKSFPPGLAYRVAYNTTEFVQQSVDEVIKTLFEAVVLVVLVIILFLQTWRAAIIPVVAIPVSLIGTFFVMAAFGFSLNNLTLFGLVLAIGIVVDDAIVVVENVERYLSEGMSPRDAAHKTMDEVGGALIAIALVLCAVFIPTAFITGISGAFYQQFALTIATATVISCIISLTLSPALAALLLRTHSHEEAKPGLLDHRGPPVQRVLLGLQQAVRQAVARLRRADAAGAPHLGADAGGLCRPDRPDLFPVRPHAVGLHPAARPRLFHHRGHVAAGLEPRADRRRDPQGQRHPAVAAGRGPHRDLRRLRRRDLHQRAELGRACSSP